MTKSTYLVILVQHLQLPQQRGLSGFVQSHPPPPALLPPTTFPDFTLYTHEPETDLRGLRVSPEGLVIVNSCSITELLCWKDTKDADLSDCFDEKVGTGVTCFA